MSSIKGPAPKPCESCPYRKDVPSGVWSAEEYLKLAEYDGPMHLQPLSIFQCHQTDRESNQSRLCAGWVGCHGPVDLMAIRVGEALGSLPLSVMSYTTDVPLFESGEAAGRHGMAEIQEPGDDARALIAKICTTRDDLRFA